MRVAPDAKTAVTWKIYGREGGFVCDMLATLGQLAEIQLKYRCVVDYEHHRVDIMEPVPDFATDRTQTPVGRT